MKFSSLSPEKISRIIILFLFFCFIHPVWRPEIYLYSSFTDDFFYYLKIAFHFNEGSGFAYTKGIPTNGYQPLHQYLVTVLVFLNQFFGFHILVFIKLVFAVIFSIASFLILRSIRPANHVTNIFFLCGLLSYFFISYSGMESLLIVPALTFLCLGIKHQRLSILQLGFLTVLSFFIRIDSIIITFPLAAYYFFSNNHFSTKRFQHLLVLFCIVAIPIFVYLFINQRFYNSYFPVSGLAKNVKTISGIHPAAFQSFIGYKPYSIFNLAITAICFLTLLNVRFRDAKYLYLLVFTTFLFYLQNAIRSDWGLWGWYFYPIAVLAFAIASETNLIVQRYWPHKARRSIITASMGIGYCCFAIGALLVILYSFPLTFINKEKKGKIDVLHVAAFKIKAFERANKGVYAMGDRAGVVGYLIESPLIQLEGLVMNKNYLETLSKEKKLSALLRRYNVDYYISSNARQLNDSSFVVSEPAKSNGHSVKITDTIHWKVANEFTLAGAGLILNSTSEVIKTTIFEVPDE